MTASPTSTSTRLLAFHRSHGKLVTLTTVRPPARYGHLVFDGDRVVEFSEKPQTGEGWINGAFFVMEPEVAEFIEGDSTQFEHEPMETSGRRGQLMAYKHESFWQCMDTLREKHILETLWESGKAPWNVWERRGERIMRVALTGHLGYVGSVMTPMLVAAGHDVVGFDTDLYRASTFGPDCPAVEVPNVVKDIRDIEARRISTASTPSSISPVCRTIRSGISTRR